MGIKRQPQSTWLQFHTDIVTVLSNTDSVTVLYTLYLNGLAFHGQTYSTD